MSARHGMSCESCRDLLMELVCEELDADTAAAVREHALTCERCGPQLAKLERTMSVASALPALSPSPDVERRIMQAARDALAAGRAKGPARETSTAPRSSFSAWFARIGSWAMSPQVAMASVLLLVVGIGLYALPIHQTPHQAALRETDEESANKTANEPAASAAANPLEQSAPQADNSREEMLRAGRANEQLDRRGGPDLLDMYARQSAGARPAPKAQSAAKPKKSAGGAAYDALEDSLGGLKAPIESKGRAREVARPEAHETYPGPAAAAPVESFAPPPPVPSASAARAPSSAPARKAASSDDAESATGKLEEKRSKEASDALGRGVAAAQRGNYAQSRALLEPIAKSGTASERAQANLWLARGYKASGDCTAALPYYRQLTQSLSAGRALLEEAAECYEQIGNLDQATNLRARAKGGASTPRK